MSTISFPCAGCGATLEYEPGTVSLVCPYCRSEQAIPQASSADASVALEELDYEDALAGAAAGATTDEVLTVRCGSCGAESALAANVTADRCPFCGTALVAEALSKKAIRPRALLPFEIAGHEAGASFRRWVNGLWFAPNRLRREAAAGRIEGVYLPFWTFDCSTRTRYRGRRGDDYTEYETDRNGRRRAVTRTRWTQVSGQVGCTFDDVLVPASGSLPEPLLAGLEPWELSQLVPYADSYLAGFRAESYALDVEAGFSKARHRIESVVRSRVRQDIGGDRQAIDASSTSYDAITFKHVLLPAWISSYRYAGKPYRFLVNGRTGAVQGERPWSWVKIAAAVIAALLVLAVILHNA